MPGLKRVERSTMAPILAILICGLAAPFAGAEDAIQVIGTDGGAHAWTVSHIKEAMASELKSVAFTSHGDKHESKAVSLLAILNASGVPTSIRMDPKAEPRLKNHNLRLAVLVMAKDGYAATFSLAELLPEIGGAEAWLALDEDGMPLSERYGLARLIVPKDQKPGRWVHDISSITVIDPTAPTTRPASEK